MRGVGIFQARRESATPTTEWANVIDGRRLVVVDRPARPYDPPRQGDTPARPATISIAHTGLRYDTGGRMSGEPVGAHVRIERISGRPRGRQAALGEKFNIARPEPATYGSRYELAGLNAEEGVYIRE